MMSNQTKTKQTVSSDVGMKVVEVLKDKALSKQVALTHELKLTIDKLNFVSIFCTHSPRCLANGSGVRDGHFDDWERDDEWNIPLWTIPMLRRSRMVLRDLQTLTVQIGGVTVGNGFIGKLTEPHASKPKRDVFVKGAM